MTVKIIAKFSKSVPKISYCNKVSYQASTTHKLEN